MRWSQGDINRHALKIARQNTKPSKYRNVKTTTRDGLVFDSKREAERWHVLKQFEKTGVITELRRQVKFPLYCPNESSLKIAQVAVYIADFVYIDKGKRVVEDAKGLKTQMYSLKKKWLELQEGIIIQEV